jgi:hypothetical protein
MEKDIKVTLQRAKYTLEDSLICINFLHTYYLNKTGNNARLVEEIRPKINKALLEIELLELNKKAEGGER